jgi:glycosyltransferase involved in cell wall biosynthesis
VVPIRLSVVIPTYHRERELIEAVRSVLAEDIPDTEVLVIDDSPTHSARDAVRTIDDTRVTYSVMPTPSHGKPALVRNFGIRQARGDIVYFLDDDDRVSPGGLSALVEALESRPRVGVAFGRVAPFGPDSVERDDFARHFEWAGTTALRFRNSSWLTSGVIMFRGTLIINSCCIIRRDLALRLGGYDASIPVYEDVEFFTRAIRRGGHVFVDRRVLQYRIGGASIIRDLEGDTAPIHESYVMMHGKYRDENPLRYRFLQVVSKALPIGAPATVV